MAYTGFELSFVFNLQQVTSLPRCLDHVTRKSYIDREALLVALGLQLRSAQVIVTRVFNRNFFYYVHLDATETKDRYDLLKLLHRGEFVFLVIAFRSKKDIMKRCYLIRNEICLAKLSISILNKAT